MAMIIKVKSSWKRPKFISYAESQAKTKPKHGKVEYDRSVERAKPSSLTRFEEKLGKTKPKWK